MSSEKYAPLFKPLRVGNITFKNRVFISSHSYCFSDEKGLPTSDMLHYLLERAKGGSSLLIMGETLVNNKFVGNRWGACISQDDIVPIYRRVVDAVAPYGMELFEQIFHPGGQTWLEDGAMAIAPSSVAHVSSGTVPSEIDVSTIKDFINDFALAARRAKEGGLAGVELKADQGKFHHQFLSSYYNRRTDRYGGSLAKRTQIVIETLEEIRKQVDTGFVVGIRIAGDTFPETSPLPKDLSLDEALEICIILENSGLVDYISVNGATNSHPKGYWISHGDSTIARANFAPLAHTIKSRVKVPVFVASQIIDPSDALQVIINQDADMVAMTRAHIADPEIMLKILEDRVDDIRPCISCNQECVGRAFQGKSVRCIHNPITGFEAELGGSPLNLVPRKKNILVVGGGVAGMEAARVAAVQGHNVMLFEKSNELGGQVLTASKAAHRQRFAEIAAYLRRQIEKLPNITIKLNHELEAKEAVELTSDHIIVATGASINTPFIHNIEAGKILTPEQILDGISSLGLDEHILIVDEDWRLHGLSIADRLTNERIQTTIITSKYFVGEGLDPVNLTSYHTRMIEKKVSMIPLTEVVSFSQTGVTIRNILTRKLTTIEGITATVFVVNRQPNNMLYSELKQYTPNVTAVGDCIFPRGIRFAILEAHRAARRITST